MFKIYTGWGDTWIFAQYHPETGIAIHVYPNTRITPVTKINILFQDVNSTIKYTRGKKKLYIIKFNSIIFPYLLFVFINLNNR